MKPHCIHLKDAVKKHLHFLNAVIRVQIQQTAVHADGQEVDRGTCCSEEHGKSLRLIGEAVLKYLLLFINETVILLNLFKILLYTDLTVSGGLHCS